MSNNIRFNDKSLAVSYIQAFLRENYSTNVLPTNTYDLQTHEALINYLQQPNVEDLSTAEGIFKERYPELTKMFVLNREQDSLIFTSKVINKATSDFISQNIDDIKQLSKSIGWEVESYNDYVNYSLDINGDDSVDNVDRSMLQRYIETRSGLTRKQVQIADFNTDGRVDNEDYAILIDFISNGKLYISFKAQDRENYFPNKDILKFVNLFTNEFYFYKAIRSDDGQGGDDKVHDDLTGKYKICIVKCKPGTTYTITHSSSVSQRLVIGSMTTNKRNIELSKLLNVVDTTVAPGNAILYTTSSHNDGPTALDAQYILIQCLSNIEDYSKLDEVVVPLALGDINLDGKIDNLDKKILSDYLYYPQEDSRRPSLTKRQLAACDINNDGKITQEDLEWLDEFLKGDRPSLGTVEYKYYVPKEINKINDVASLLIMEGNMVEVETGETGSSEVGTFYPQEQDILFTQEGTFDDLSNMEVELNYEVSEENEYDHIDYKASFLELQGNTEIKYFDETNNITPYKPLSVLSTTDITIKVNEGNLIDRDLSSTKLARINGVYDRIFQQQNKFYYTQSITEVFSQDLNWVRRTTISGTSYLRSNITPFKPSQSAEVGNILSNKFKVVDANDILNEVFTNQYEIAIDEEGRLLLYSSEINNLPLEIDMLAWISNNRFYIYGELQTHTTTQISDEISTLDLQEGMNNIVITTQSVLPKQITLQSYVAGITDSHIDRSQVSFPISKSPIGLNFSSFTEDPWVVNHKIIPYILGYSITPYSRSEEITYVQNMIQDIYPETHGRFIPGIYSDELKELVEKFQRSYIHYKKGDLTLDNVIDLTDIELLEGYLNGTNELSESQLIIADTNSDSVVDITDVNNLYKEYNHINDYLKSFDIEFIFGYVDPSTEYRMQKFLNTKLGASKHEVGWNSSRPH